MKNYFLNLLKALLNIPDKYYEHEEYKIYNEKNNAMIFHLRDMFHNLPYNLNLPPVETEFLSDVFAELDRLYKRQFSFYTLYNIEHLRRKYVGTYAGHTYQTIVTDEEFDNLKSSDPDPEIILKICKAILFNNSSRYETSTPWYKSKPVKNDIVDIKLSYNLDRYEEINNWFSHRNKK